MAEKRRVYINTTKGVKEVDEESIPPSERYKSNIPLSRSIRKERRKETTVGGQRRQYNTPQRTKSTNNPPKGKLWEDDPESWFGKFVRMMGHKDFTEEEKKELKEMERQERIYQREQRNKPKKTEEEIYRETYLKPKNVTDFSHIPKNVMNAVWQKMLDDETVDMSDRSKQNTYMEKELKKMGYQF